MDGGHDIPSADQVQIDYVACIYVDLTVGPVGRSASLTASLCSVPQLFPECAALASQSEATFSLRLPAARPSRANASTRTLRQLPVRFFF